MIKFRYVWLCAACVLTSVVFSAPDKLGSGYHVVISGRIRSSTYGSIEFLCSSTRIRDKVQIYLAYGGLFHESLIEVPDNSALKDSAKILRLTPEISTASFNRLLFGGGAFVEVSLIEDESLLVSRRSIIVDENCDQSRWIAGILDLLYSSAKGSSIELVIDAIQRQSGFKPAIRNSLTDLDTVELFRLSNDGYQALKENLSQQNTQVTTVDISNAVQRLEAWNYHDFSTFIKDKKLKLKANKGLAEVTIEDGVERSKLIIDTEVKRFLYLDEALFIKKH